MGPPAVRLAQHPTPGASHGQRCQLFPGIGDLKPASQDSRSVQLGMNLDCYGADSVLKRDHGL